MGNHIYKTTYIVKKMDCPAEEEIIRIKLQGLWNIISIDIDIPTKKLQVYHVGDNKEITQYLDSLDLGVQLITSQKTEDKIKKGKEYYEKTRIQKGVLIQVLIINLSFFCLEMITGFMADSMGLIADSLDMLADSIVYSLSLLAVGAHESKKKMVAGVSGYFQGFLAIMGFVEVLRRFLGYGENPDFKMMIVISVLALIGNIICLNLLKRSKSREAHMQASMIFTSNDVIVNAGVIIAGILVYFTVSRIPDLIIGAIIFILVGRGAYRIIKLSR